MKTYFNNILIGAVALLALSSCEHKELCYDHNHKAKIKVEFDWTDAPDANAEGMCVYFYPLNSRASYNYYRFDFNGMQGGEVSLPYGEYGIITYNNDTESVLMANHDYFDSHTAFTREGNLFEPIGGATSSKALRAEGAENERVVISPDMIWGCALPVVKVAESGVSYAHGPEAGKDQWANQTVNHPDQVITLFPHEMVCTYTVEVRHVTGLENVVQLSASLSGMSPSLLFSTEELSSECVTLPFSAEHDGVSTIRSKFYTFGHHTDNEAPHRMLLYVWLKDGSKWYYGRETSSKFNVTDQVHSAPDRRHVDIIIDGLDMPTPIEGDKGYQPGFDDWGEIWKDVVM